MRVDKAIERLRPAVERIQAECEANQGQLIAVIKRQPRANILAAYQLGLRAGRVDKLLEYWLEADA